MNARPQPYSVSLHIEQLPPDVRQWVEQYRANPTDPCVALRDEGQARGYDSIVFARHAIFFGERAHGDLQILTTDHFGNVAQVEVGAHFSTIQVLAKPRQTGLARFSYRTKDEAQLAWSDFRNRRVQWFDALNAGDDARAHALDPLTGWARAGYPALPLPAHVQAQRDARQAKDRRKGKILGGCCAVVVALVAIIGIGLVGKKVLADRQRRRDDSARAAQFRQEQAARTFAATSPAAAPLDVEGTMARITPQLASPAAVAFFRALLTDMAARPAPDRWVAAQVTYPDDTSSAAIDGEMRRRGSQGLANARMWLAIPFAAERATTDVFSRLGITSVRFQRPTFGPGSDAPRPKLVARLTERVSNERYRMSSGYPFFGLDTLLDVELTVPGRPERLSSHVETLASPARLVRLGLEGPRATYEADRRRAGEDLHRTVNALLVR